jgi:hypothetical protein
MSIHGDKTQQERDHVLQGMYQRQCSYLVLYIMVLFFVFQKSAFQILCSQLATLCYGLHCSPQSLKANVGIVL